MDTSRAVVLAAGYGSRLAPAEDFKLMATVGGRSMLANHADNFAALGVDRLVVVTGWRGEELADRILACEPDLPVAVEPVHNPNFDASNGLSVLAGVSALSGDEGAPPFWLTMSDHLYDPALFDDLEHRFEQAVDAETGGALLVDHKLETIFDMPDATKVRLTGEFAIGKQLEDFQAVDTGLFWCGRPFVQALRQARDEKGDCSTSDAVGRLVERDRFAFVDIGDRLWQDVDTPEAREHAGRLWEENFER